MIEQIEWIEVAQALPAPNVIVLITATDTPDAVWLAEHDGDEWLSVVGDIYGAPGNAEGLPVVVAWAARPKGWHAAADDAGAAMIDLQQLRFVGLGMIPKAGTDMIAHAADELETLRKAADEVLRVYMPQFSDSRAVDDCLVKLATARSQFINQPDPPAARGGCGGGRDVSFDEQPDADIHGECAAEIARLSVFERRYNDMIANPIGARHLLALLSAGNGTADDFGKMLDRIHVSRAPGSRDAEPTASIKEGVT